ncbi:hypothetical protein B0H14DRAFT_3436958 [Mycena olivaceomarginata]|nr:hypothetical protein B0H14DRAFT_3436958 [Mycena olivaceomarginata]
MENLTTGGSTGVIFFASGQAVLTPPTPVHTSLPRIMCFKITLTLTLTLATNPTFSIFAKPGSLSRSSASCTHPPFEPLAAVVAGTRWTLAAAGACRAWRLQVVMRAQIDCEGGARRSHRTAGIHPCFARRELCAWMAVVHHTASVAPRVKWEEGVVGRADRKK